MKMERKKERKRELKIEIYERLEKTLGGGGGCIDRYDDGIYI